MIRLPLARPGVPGLNRTVPRRHTGPFPASPSPSPSHQPRAVAR